MTKAYINEIATAHPPHNVHQAFTLFAEQLLPNKAQQQLFKRMAEKSHIARRFSVLSPRELSHHEQATPSPFYKQGAFPTTARRMQLFEQHAPSLALQSVQQLRVNKDEITHLIITTCTGFFAPGIDYALTSALALPASAERTVIGFMGCYAAMNALKLARHIVHAEAKAKVLIVSVELCTLHLQETETIEQLLSFLLFGDGAAAAIVSREAQGFALERFHHVLVPESQALITWRIGDFGFDMHLSGKVPARIRKCLADKKGADFHPKAIDHWAVHPGGRSILDAVEAGLSLAPDALSTSRKVLKNYGNMSSATILFVLKELMEKVEAGERGCAMSFGPGLTLETCLFHKV